jgi:hypothetical protein
MVKQNNMSDTILRLKKVRLERGLTYNDVFNLVQQSGGYVSIGTIRRVFSAESEYRNFRYVDSIKPIAIALLGADDEASRINEYSAIVDSAMLDKQQRFYLDLMDKQAGELESYRKEAEHLRIVNKRLLRSLIVVGSILVAILLALSAALAIDLIDPNWGLIFK